MTAECPKCGPGKITTVWPLANETRAGAFRSGKLKLMCFAANHEFEIVLPKVPGQLNRMLNEAFHSA